MADSIMTSMNEIDYGTSKEGIEQLKKDLNIILVKEASEALGNTQPIFNALLKGWNGPDMGAFYSQFVKAEKEVEADLEVLYNAIVGEFDSIYESWVTFQNKNVTSD